MFMLASGREPSPLAVHSRRTTNIERRPIHMDTAGCNLPRPLNAAQLSTMVQTHLHV